MTGDDLATIRYHQFDPDQDGNLLVVCRYVDVDEHQCVRPMRAHVYHAVPTFDLAFERVRALAGSYPISWSAEPLGAGVPHAWARQTEAGHPLGYSVQLWPDGIGAGQPAASYLVEVGVGIDAEDSRRFELAMRGIQLDTDPGIWSGRDLPREAASVAENALRRYRDAVRRSSELQIRTIERAAGMQRDPVPMLVAAVGHIASAAELARVLQQLTGDPDWVPIVRRVEQQSARLQLTLANRLRP